MRLVDSHCHLDDERFDSDRDDVIQRALDAGVHCIMTIGTGDGPPDLEVAVRLADKYEVVVATAGIHPHYASKADDAALAHVRDLLRHPKVVALGEIGLDYHYDNSPRDVQRSVFTEQLGIAREAGKPVVVHTREAWEDTLTIIGTDWASSGLRGIMHSFTGGPAEARRCLELDFFISFAGIVTFPKAADIHASARFVPLDRMLIETDAPYLAPVPHRGKRNEPAFVGATAARIAALRGIDTATVAETTSANFERLLNWNIPWASAT
jgi:TatD DNase family protein